MLLPDIEIIHTKMKIQGLITMTKAQVMGRLMQLVLEELKTTEEW